MLGALIAVNFSLRDTENIVTLIPRTTGRYSRQSETTNFNRDLNMCPVKTRHGTFCVPSRSRTCDIWRAKQMGYVYILATNPDK